MRGSLPGGRLHQEAVERALMKGGDDVVCGPGGPRTASTRGPGGGARPARRWPSRWRRRWPRVIALIPSTYSPYEQSGKEAPGGSGAAYFVTKTRRGGIWGQPGKRALHQWSGGRAADRKKRAVHSIAPWTLDKRPARPGHARSDRPPRTAHTGLTGHDHIGRRHS